MAKKKTAQLDLEAYHKQKVAPHLLRMPHGALVMTYVLRQDLCDGRLATYTRGCGAVLS